MTLDELREKYFDPRPDIKKDHELWLRILLGAKVYPDLHARLHFIRCLGGYITETKTMYQLLPGEIPLQEWDMVRTKILQPIAEVLTEYFKFCRSFTEITDEKLIEEAAKLFEPKQPDKPKQLVFGEKVR